MTAAELQETFGLSREDWRRIAAEPEMIEPIDPKYTNGVTQWSGHGFVRWLAAHHPDLAHRTPHLLRPAKELAAQYYGGTYTKRADGFHHEHFAGCWRTAFGSLAIVYPRHHTVPPQELLEHHPEVTTVVVVQHDWNLYGLPNLEAADRAHPTLVYEPRWSELAAHIGSPIPWWPSELRRDSHLTAWKPAHTPEPVQVLTWPEWEPLYDMAFREAKGTPLRLACLSAGREIRSRAVKHTLWEIGKMNELKEAKEDSDYAKRKEAERAWMVIPAFPDLKDPAETETADPETVREGLAQLCQRTDDLAVECLEQISMWSGKDLPFGGSFSVTTTEATPAGAEWIKRLKATEPTAIHRVWDSEHDQITGTFTDPVTNSPVVTKKGYYTSRPTDEVSFHSYAPRQLPEGSRIAEVILDGPIWVRTHDGTLYPAPSMDAPGLSWGYVGSGPGTLAVLIGRLLDNGAAHAVTYEDDDSFNAEPKIEALLQIKHKRGTRLSRRLLEDVRENGLDNLGFLDRVRLGRIRST
ncbi:hypothetical protein [Streptomyces netropsis]|uniref:Uncharacterized protein n=1 Tax=Streptomyces netropsis TaxID=55404 RepID=A0A7W7PJ58_STRNE|nr:hypothetical protein [Streptomyces netropsis]MBB4890435.1 hypothetical protein [Streptomyces netropsis]